MSNGFLDKIIEDNEILLSKMEDIDYTPINEIGLHKSESDHIYIGAFGKKDRNFDTAPYLKISWQNNLEDNTKVARINMKTAKYETHYNMNVEIPAEIIKNMDKILSRKSTAKGFEDYTVWDAILKQTNDLNGGSEKDFEDMKKQISYSNFISEIEDIEFPKGITRKRWKGQIPKL